MKLFSSGSCRDPEWSNRGLQAMNIPKKILRHGPSTVSGFINMNTVSSVIIFFITKFLMEIVPSL